MASCDQFKCFKKRGLHFLHLNARSILPKIDHLHNLATNTNAAVIAITETWLDDTVTDGEVGIPGYVLERRDRNREGGGVGLYIRNDIAFNRRDDLQDSELEFIAVDILLPKTKPILVAATYRPPKDSKFYNRLEDVLLNSPHYNQQETFFLGDFNTDILAKRNNLNSALKGFLSVFDMCQLIDEPTRTTTTSKTAIDLIVTSDKEKVSQSGVLPYCISDHNVIYCTRKVKKYQVNKHNVQQIRSMKMYSAGALIDRLRSVNWLEVLNDEDVNSAWTKFSVLFLKVIDEIAPVKTVRLKQNSEPWFSGEILDLISRRDKAWIKFRKNNSEENFKNYKQLRNLAQYSVKKAKKEFVKSEINENQNSPKKIWKILKNLGMPSKTKSGCSNIGLRKESDEICFDTKFVADRFNNFFCNIASKLLEKLPYRRFDEDKIVEFYQKQSVKLKSFSLNVVTDTEIEKLLKSLSVSKSTGCDKISAKFLKDSAEVIANPLAYIINLSLHTSTVPVDFKTARVVPLYKKGDRNCEGNYRPVSILPVVSKIMERVVYNQLSTYLNENNLIYDFQSGFRASFSTDTALSFLTDSIKFNMDSGLYTGVVLIDLQKAFDTVDHSILASKLKAIGLSKPAVSWFASYLSEREQFVDVSGTHSDAGGVTCGVPQGSILGPLLFTIYVNDMISAVKCELYLYADDSALVVSGKNPKQIENILSSELMSISTWLQENKLSLHLGKTESILFGSKKKLSKCSQMSISCNNVDICSKSQVKYLGITIDHDMSGTTMGTSVIRNINSKIKFLYRKGSYFGFKEKKMLCSAIIQPSFDYACNSWYRGLQQTLKNKLQVCQNKIIRYMLGYPNRQHLYFKDFKKVGLLNVVNRVDYLSLGLMFGVYNNTAPKYLCNIKHVSHQYNTRSRDLAIEIPDVKTQGSKTFQYTGIKLWNSLPLNIRELDQKTVFKKEVRSFLFKEMHRLESSDVIYY